MKKFYLYILTLLVLFIIAPSVAKAECSWTTESACNDLGYFWSESDDTECTGTKPSNGRCCCAQGCCRYQYNISGEFFSTLSKSDSSCRAFVIANLPLYKYISFDETKIPDGKGYCSARPVISNDNQGGGNLPDSQGGSNVQTGKTYKTYPNPLGTVDIREVIGNVVRAILLIIGSLALIMFVYGGFVWLTSAGNEQKVEKGRNVLIWSALGLIIVFSAYVVVRYVMEAVGAITPS